MQFSKSGSWLLIILAFSLPMVAFTHITGDGFVTEHGSMSPAVLSWGSEGKAHFYVSTLTTVIELLVQLSRSCPCSREGCVRSGASRAVILSLSGADKAVSGACVQCGFPRQEKCGCTGESSVKGQECHGGAGASPFMSTG